MTDAWYEYALLGGTCDTYEKGKDYYDKINKLYSKKFTSMYSKEVEQKYSEGVILQFFKRHIIALFGCCFSGRAYS